MKNCILIMALMSVLICPQSYAQTVAEAQENFTYAGKPIHPFTVGKFLGGFDRVKYNISPIITSIDLVSSHQKNEYEDMVHGNRRLFDWEF